MKNSQGHKYILSFDDNEQLILESHETCEVKQVQNHLKTEQFSPGF